MFESAVPGRQDHLSRPSTPKSVPLARRAGWLVAALALVLAACGPKEGASTVAAAAPSASGAVAAPPPFQAASAPPETEARIRQALAQRLPTLPPIDEVRTSPVGGLFEVRFGGAEIVYVDATGNYILQGALLRSHDMTDLTAQRVDQVTAVAFSALPLKDAIVFTQGQGRRKLAVFEDPRCSFCKRFERDLVALDDVTVYVFLMPILGPDSVVKSRNIWCAADPAKAWRDWMLEDKLPPAAGADCDAQALQRNVAFGRKHRVNGTPALFFEDGSRRAGAMPAPAVEEILAAAARKS